MSRATAWRGADRWGRQGHGGLTLQAGEVATYPRAPGLWHGIKLLIAFAVWTAAIMGACVFAMAVL